VQHQKELTEGE